jgi:hypothetical protein
MLDKWGLPGNPKEKNRILEKEGMFGEMNLDMSERLSQPKAVIFGRPGRNSWIVCKGPQRVCKVSSAVGGRCRFLFSQETRIIFKCLWFLRNNNSGCSSP